jgi:hypothetical protein
MHAARPAALLEDRALPALLTEALVVTMTRAGARPVTLTAKRSVLAMIAGISSSSNITEKGRDNTHESGH